MAEERVRGKIYLYIESEEGHPTFQAIFIDAGSGYLGHRLMLTDGYRRYINLETRGYSVPRREHPDYQYEIREITPEELIEWFQNLDLQGWSSLYDFIDHFRSQYELHRDAWGMIDEAKNAVPNRYP